MTKTMRIHMTEFKPSDDDGERIGEEQDENPEQVGVNNVPKK